MSILHRRKKNPRLLLRIAAAALLAPVFSPARAAPPNRVLKLDGNNSYVELPAGIFDSLKAATVEGWVKWERLRLTDRFFDFGDKNHELYVRSDGPQLNFLITDPGGSRHRVEVAGILKTGEWMHLAAVSGPGGAKLYCNGVLAGTHASTASFSGLKGTHNYLGKSNYSSRDPSSQGTMDEVRVWNHARTAEQIRAGMFKTLSGAEKGLAGYWNFDDGTAADLSPGKHDGVPAGKPLFGPGDGDIIDDYLDPRRIRDLASVAAEHKRPLEIITDRNLITEYKHNSR